MRLSWRVLGCDRNLKSPSLALVDSMFDRAFASEVDAWRALGRGRRLEQFAKKASMVDFTSNDILGLSRHPEVLSAAMAATAEHGAGGRASRLLGGGAPTTRALESQAAAWLGAEDALLFPSGYQANLTLLSAIAGPGDAVVSDELNHASLIDGLRLSRATVTVVRHGDLEHFEHALSAASGARRRFVVTESIFSMNGDAAPLTELAALCDRHRAGLVVDEAHAAGVVGPEGRGEWAAMDIAAQCLVARLITGGKALGVGGALIAGSKALVEMLVHRGRGFVFSTAVAPALVGGLEKAIAIAAGANDERARLHVNAQRLARALGLPSPRAAIVPFTVGGEAATVELAARLAASGHDVRAVRPPTVPVDTSRLRIVCHATHTAAQIDGLVEALGGEQHANNRNETRLLRRTPRPSPLFVVGTDTGIGKTVVSAVLARALDAHYWKPVQTGEDCDTTEVSRIANALKDGTERAIAKPTYAFPLPASPHTAAHAVEATIDPALLDADLARYVQAAGDTRLIVELAGGLIVPLAESFTQADWVQRVQPDVVLVARSGLGTLNHTLLTLEALQRRRIIPRALILVGDVHAANRDTLRPHVRALFELPHLPSLETRAVDHWLRGTDFAGALA